METLDRECDLAPDELVALADGELGEARAGLAAHAAACPVCRRRLAAGREVRALLRDGALPDDPVGRAAVRARLARAGDGTWTGTRRDLVAAGAVLALLSALLAGARPWPGGPQPGPSSTGGGQRPARRDGVPARVLPTPPRQGGGAPRLRVVRAEPGRRWLAIFDRDPAGRPAVAVWVSGRGRAGGRAIGSPGTVAPGWS